jgi:hypothetical protein
MKKLLFILLACSISVTIVPWGFAQTPDGETPALETVCDGLEGQAFELCEAYCEAQDCDEYPDQNSCTVLKRNYARVTGIDYLPCDTIACCLCADVVGFGTEGVCVQVQAIECADPALPVGEFACEDVSCPAITDGTNPSCLLPEEPQPPFFATLIPPCQNGLPAFVCSGILKGEVLPPNSCPAPPSCF